MHPAVLHSISYVIRCCKKYEVETSICGQAGSKPEMVEFLLKEGIDSISTNADAAYNVSVIVAESEKKMPVHKVTRERVEQPKMKFFVQPHSTESHAVHASPIGARPMMVQTAQMSDRPALASGEELILKQIENWGKEDDDYNPGAGAIKNDVPPLNDAIPVTSEHLQQRPSDIEMIELSTEIPETGELFERQQDTIFDAIVVSEVAENIPQPSGNGQPAEIDLQGLIDEG